MLDLQALVSAAKRKVAADKLAKQKIIVEKDEAKRQIQAFLNNILCWEPSGIVLQELHQTCNCCGENMVSVNSVMLEKKNKMTYAIKTSILPPNHGLDLSSIPRKKLIIHQDIPMCPQCFQLSELIDLCYRPVSIGLENAQKDLFL